MNNYNIIILRRNWLYWCKLDSHASVTGQTYL